MLQYVYLMRHRGTRKCKIGIARRPEVRLRQVDRAVAGKVELIYARPMLFAPLVEKFLHSRFATLRFRLSDAGQGAGHTEWFRLFFWQRLLVCFWIGTLSFLPILLLLIYVAYYFYEEIFFWISEVLALLLPAAG